MYGKKPTTVFYYKLFCVFFSFLHVEFSIIHTTHMIQ